MCLKSAAVIKKKSEVKKVEFTLSADEVAKKCLEGYIKEVETLLESDDVKSRISGVASKIL